VLKPPNKNWPQTFTHRYPELKVRRNRAMNWNRHNNNIHSKIIQGFEVIEAELCKPGIVPENVYNMDETRVMLSLLGCVKVLISKDN
jgi:hypothetical protein